ncbi:MAG: AAA family ATPase [Prevotella sp.]|jgi:AAA15 family ATPase/GTPase
MIASFTVENYLSILSPVTFSFEPTGDKFLADEYTHTVKEGVNLLKVGIIYGANATGKTNLLQALNALRNILCLPTEDKTRPLDIIPFLLDEESRTHPTRFELSFYIESEKYLLQLEADNKRIYLEKLQYYPSSKAALLYERRHDEQSDVVVINWGNYLGLGKKSCQAIEGNTIGNMSVLAAWSKSNVETSRLNAVYQYFSEHFFPPMSGAASLASYTKDALSNDDGGAITAFVRKFLKASDFNISDIEIEDEEIHLDETLSSFITALPISENMKMEWLKDGVIRKEQFVFSHTTSKGAYKLPEQLESAGTLQMLALSVLLYKVLHQESIIIIDEIESSLHYELLSYFLRTFLASSEVASQMLLTTHDLNLLNEDFVRRDTVWFTQKNENATTRLTRLSDYGLHKNVSPYNAYKQNKLAPLPFLGSQYIDINEN